MLEFFDNKNFNEINELNNNDKWIEMLDISNLSEDDLNALLDEGFRDIGKAIIKQPKKLLKIFMINLPFIWKAKANANQNLCFIANAKANAKFYVCFYVCFCI